MQFETTFPCLAHSIWEKRGAKNKPSKIVRSKMILQDSAISQ